MQAIQLYDKQILRIYCTTSIGIYISLMIYGFFVLLTILILYSLHIQYLIMHTENLIQTQNQDSKNNSMSVQELNNIIQQKDQMIASYVSKLGQKQEKVQSLSKQIQKINCEIKQKKYQSCNKPLNIQNVKLLIQNGFVQLLSNNRYILVQIEQNAFQISLSSNLKIVKKQLMKQDNIQMNNMKLYCERVLSEVQKIKEMSKNIEIQKQNIIKKQNQLKDRQEKISKIVKQNFEKKINVCFDQVQTEKQQIAEVISEQIQTQQIQIIKTQKVALFKQFQQSKQNIQQYGIQTQEQIPSQNHPNAKIQKVTFQTGKLNQIPAIQNWTCEQEQSQKKQSFVQTSQFSTHIQKQKQQQQVPALNRPRSISFSNKDIIYQIDEQNSIQEENNQKYLQNRNSIQKSRKQTLKKRSSIDSKSQQKKQNTQRTSQQNNSKTKQIVKQQESLGGFVQEMLNLKDPKNMTERLLDKKNNLFVNVSDHEVQNASNLSEASQSFRKLSSFGIKQSAKNIQQPKNIQDLNKIKTPLQSQLLNSNQKKPQPLKWQSLLKLPQKQSESSKKKPKTIYIRR